MREKTEQPEHASHVFTLNTRVRSTSDAQRRDASTSAAHDVKTALARDDGKAGSCEIDYKRILVSTRVEKAALILNGSLCRAIISFDSFNESRASFDPAYCDARRSLAISILQIRVPSRKNSILLRSAQRFLFVLG